MLLAGAVPVNVAGTVVYDYIVSTIWECVVCTGISAPAYVFAAHKSY